MTDNVYRLGKRNRRAASFTTWFCDNPNCGIHIVSFDEAHNIICETVTSPIQSLKLAAEITHGLVEKAEEVDAGS